MLDVWLFYNDTNIRFFRSFKTNNKTGVYRLEFGFITYRLPFILFKTEKIDRDISDPAFDKPANANRTK